MTVHPFKQLLSGVISDKRPMDNVKLSLDTPQEDELGVNVSLVKLQTRCGALLNANFATGVVSRHDHVHAHCHDVDRA